MAYKDFLENLGPWIALSTLLTHILFKTVFDTRQVKPVIRTLDENDGRRTRIYYSKYESLVKDGHQRRRQFFQKLHDENQRLMKDLADRQERRLSQLSQRLCDEYQKLTRELVGTVQRILAELAANHQPCRTVSNVPGSSPKW